MNTLSSSFNLSDCLTLIISFIALTISFLSYKNSSKLNKAQLKSLTKQQLPNLQILSITSTKCNPNTSHIEHGKYCRIYYGDTTSNISLDGKIATFDAEDKNNNIENGFIDEIKSNMYKKVYFTYFNNRPYLIINHATDKDNFIIDHSNVKIIFHNYGAKISALGIESFKIYYRHGMNISSLTLNGTDSKITLTPQENGKLELFFDEVTTNLDNSMCKLPSNVYESIPKRTNLLKSRMSQNILNYQKLEITLLCWDMYNIPIKCLITLEYNGNFFTSTTTLL